MKQFAVEWFSRDDGWLSMGFPFPNRETAEKFKEIYEKVDSVNQFRVYEVTHDPKRR